MEKQATRENFQLVCRAYGRLLLVGGARKQLGTARDCRVPLGLPVPPPFRVRQRGDPQSTMISPSTNLSPFAFDEDEALQSTSCWYAPTSLFSPKTSGALLQSSPLARERLDTLLSSSSLFGQLQQELATNSSPPAMVLQKFLQRDDLFPKRPRRPAFKGFKSRRDLMAGVDPPILR